MSRRTIHTNERGFTLIELLVVVLILGILAAIALPMYLSSIADSNKKSCHANMRIVATALQSFLTADTSHAYPTDLAHLVVGPVASVGGTAIPDLTAPGPRCPENTLGLAQDYTWTIAAAGTGGTFTISCNADLANHGTLANGVYSIP